MTRNGNGKRTHVCNQCGQPWSIFPSLHAAACIAALSLSGVGGRTREYAINRYRSLVAVDGAVQPPRRHRAKGTDAKA